MPFILSRMSADVDYVIYLEGASGHRAVGKAITVKGGAGVANSSSIYTPQGITTEVSKEQLEALESHPLFVAQKNNGFLAIIAAADVKESKKKSEDMPKDKSSPLTQEDYADDKKGVTVTTKKTKKAKK